MGMYDLIRCKMPLPAKLAGDPSEHWFQTKSLNHELDHYEIREDGTLWHEAYDTEDRSNPNGVGLEKIIGCMTPINKRWEQWKRFTGEVVFYDWLHMVEGTESKTADDWIEFSAYFVYGKLQSLNLVEFPDQ